MSCCRSSIEPHVQCIGVQPLLQLIVGAAKDCWQKHALDTGPLSELVPVGNSTACPVG